MKRTALLAACLAIALCLPSSLPWTATSEALASPKPIRIELEGKELPLAAPAYIEQGSTLVPVREIAEALGAKVTYDKKNGERTIRLTKGEREALLTIGSKGMLAQGRSIALTAAPRTVNSVTFVPLRAISEALGTVVTWDGQTRTVHIDKPLELPAVGTEEKLIELLKSTPTDDSAIISLPGLSIQGKEEVPVDSSAPPVAEANGEAGAPGTDYSQTNIQVSGVDEADWAKTDGRFIYQISGSRVVITDISNPDQPRLASELTYGSKEQFQPEQLYVDDTRLIVIGYTTDYGVDTIQTPSEQTTVMPESESMPLLLPPPMKQSVKSYIYDLQSSGQPKLKRTLEQEGSYLSSRKIGDALYIITNKLYRNYSLYAKSKGLHLDAMTGQQTDFNQLAASLRPVYADSAVSDKPQNVSLDDIHYFPDIIDYSVLLVGAIDLGQPEGQLQLSAYLGSGDKIFVSQRHLYVSQLLYKAKDKDFEMVTKFHKFRLDYGSVLYMGEGTVPGYVTDPFSMNEHEGYFRVALTNGDLTSDYPGESSQIYILDEKLRIIGKLDGIAPGERMYSVRFMGKRAYMVTFRNVDPLFAIDLSNPQQPKILGQLKIPGYSDYLHPYDENHLIGFGKDTTEIKGFGSNDTRAIATGMKIALFDVSDVSRPKEKFKEIIGDIGTQSELLNDYKALLFSKEKGLLAFPVTLYEIKDKDAEGNADAFAHGQFAYQGAYVYSIDLEKGFRLRDRITHLSDEEMLKSGMYSYNYSKAVRRIMYAGDTLYTLSDAMLKANYLSDLKERGELLYP
ncbi:beta-propeller domain-containing protein [Paenibacillus sp. NPDC057967]|uniref:beta-propeller domain-containing protein n=1 Tax=Paenibacillus sp. NPDC057967 TaxID=3346293 RepID=UPI0036DB2E4A